MIAWGQFPRSIDRTFDIEPHSILCDLCPLFFVLSEAGPESGRNALDTVPTFIRTVLSGMNPLLAFINHAHCRVD